MSKHRTPGKFSVVNTPAGKAKIVDQNGFSIATAPDTRKESTNNVQFLSKAPEMYELLKKLENEVLAHDYNEHWDSYKQILELLKQIDNE